MNKANFQAGLTLIELLVVTAIISIMAGVVMISISGYRQDARSAKALATVSGAIPSAVSCMGNGGTVQNPTQGGGGDICSLGAGYGTWPVLHASGTDLENYLYGAYVFTSTRSWYMRAYSGSAADNVAICCNSTMNNCGIIGAGTTAVLQTCLATKTW